MMGNKEFAATTCEGLGTAKDSVVLLRRDVIPGYSGNDGPFRERKFPFAIAFDPYVIPQNADIVVSAVYCEASNRIDDASDLILHSGFFPGGFSMAREFATLGGE